jgi:hypothetical protein
MMKYLLLCMTLGIIAPCMVFSQDQTVAEELIASPEQTSEPQTRKDAFVLPPSIIGFDLVWVDFLGQSSFFMLDGRYVTYNEMKPRLLTVPGNEKLLRRAEGWEISTFVNMSLGLAAVVGWGAINLIPDIPNQDYWEVGALMVAFIEMGVASFSSLFRAENMHRVIKNYNLFIMGIPL